MPNKKHKRFLMLFGILIATPFLIIFITLQINQAHLLDTPGLSKRLKIFLRTNVAEIKPGAVLPELEPPVFKLSGEQLYEKTLNAIDTLGWQLTTSNPQNGKIQVVVTTSLFSFKDDIEVSIIDIGKNSSILAVSRSRVGRGDLAANSSHLQKLLRQLAKP